jgi:hypothetical protein
MNIVFKNEDYNSNDGMLTYVWGPALWHTLHTISFNYPIKPTEEQKTQYYDFFIGLKNILPCKHCRDNYSKNLEIFPLTKSKLKNRDTLSRWLYEMHEIINKHLDKKSNLTYEIVRDRYEHFRSRCLIDPKSKNNSKEKGCTEPLYGVKSKCVINIIPKKSKKESFKIDKRCKITK